jgi:hypothetical protein
MPYKHVLAQQFSASIFVERLIGTTMVTSKISDLLRSANQSVAIWFLGLAVIAYALYRVCPDYFYRCLRTDETPSGRLLPTFPRSRVFQRFPELYQSLDTCWNLEKTMQQYARVGGVDMASPSFKFDSEIHALLWSTRLRM